MARKRAKVGKAQVDKKMEALKKTIEDFIKDNEPDKNLLKANSNLLREKEDLEYNYKILLEEKQKLRREARSALDDNIKLREKIKGYEADLRAYKELKENLARLTPR